MPIEEWRLLDIDTPDSAAMNLAIDEAIFIGKIKRTVPSTLRFWRNKSAVVIGYSQNIEAEVNLDLCLKQKIQIIRRFSGGGAVYQDLGNLNYSLAVEADHPFFKGLDLIESFRIFSSGVVEGLKEFGVCLVFDPPSDLLIKGKKISGNAQSRRKGVIFHHGTLLVNSHINLLTKVLDAPKVKMENKGITSKKRPVINLEDVIDYRISVSKVKGALSRGFEKAFSMKLIPGVLTFEEKRVAESLYAEKYSSEKWNFWR